MEQLKLFFKQNVWLKWLLIGITTFTVGILAVNGLFGIWNYATNSNEIKVLRKEKQAAIDRADKDAAKVVEIEKQLVLLKEQKAQEQKKYEQIKLETKKLEDEVRQIQSGNRRPVGTLDERVERLGSILDSLDNTNPARDGNAP